MTCCQNDATIGLVFTDDTGDWWGWHQAILCYYYFRYLKYGREVHVRVNMQVYLLFCEGGIFSAHALTLVGTIHIALGPPFK